MLTNQDGFSTPEVIDIGISKMAWEPVWAPDGSRIAFVDDDVRVRVLNLETKTIQTVDVGGINIERGNMGLNWSPDSKWLAYTKSASNYFRQVKIWSVATGEVRSATNFFADAFSPAWDRGGQYLYFLASTEIAQRSGWANTSAINPRPEYAAYVINLQKDQPSPFKLRSDEEEAESPNPDQDKDTNKKKDKKKEDKSDESEIKAVGIDFETLDRRTIPMPIPEAAYSVLLAGPEGVVFIGERKADQPGLKLHKFSMKEREAKPFADGVGSLSISADGKKLLARAGGAWKIMDTNGASGNDAKPIKVDLQVKLDRSQEWKQIFEEAWRYERDYFYDPALHGRDWQVVYDRYAPLIPFVKHRADLNYILDQMNGELSVGHSFVGGGDYPEVATSKVGLLGADFSAVNGRWRIDRIYTTESWNPGLTSPLDEPGKNIKEGYYLVGINGQELTSQQNLYQQLDGTLDQQTVLHLNDAPTFEGARKEVVKPIRSEAALRQRAWVEDNRRKVDSLSNGRLAYVWVPNTSSRGLVSFNRYFFAQQNKDGAVIDERHNGGGLLDDYMVDLMTRSLRAAYTNEVPNGKPGVLPAGILGPKALLINEMAGSGGDFFPWVFRQQNAGPLIGATTWGGLVKSSVHYPMVDGGYLTAPDNAIFDPVKGEWIAENKGVAPDIPVRNTAQTSSQGRDLQLEKAVEYLLDQLEENPPIEVERPAYSTPATREEE
jgi:tricorn protease